MPASRTLAKRMIDYLALTIGHGLLALAFWHLFMRESVDRDPLLDEVRQAEADNRRRTSTAGRNAARRTDRSDAA